jgi:hypothetical protein
MLRKLLVVSVTLMLTLSIACSKKKEEGTAGPRAIRDAALPESIELPDQAIGVAIFAEPARVFADLEKLAALVGPVPPGALTAAVYQGLLQVGLKDTSVVDLNGPAGLLILDPKQHKAPVVMACTVKSKQSLIESSKPTWNRKGEQDDVIELTRDVVDTYGVYKGGAQAPPKITQSIFLKFSDHTLIVANDREAMKIGAPILGKLLTSGHGVFGTLRIDHLRKIFATELAGLPAMLKRQLAAGRSMQQFPDPEKMQWFMGWMVDKMIALLDQTREVTFAADCDKNGASVEMGIKPEDGSFFAKLLAAQKHSPLKLIDALPEDHFMVMGVNVQWDLFKPDLIDFTKEIFKVFFEKELSAELIAVFQQMWQVLGDEIAFSENLGATGLSAVEFFTVKDEAKAREVFEKSFALVAKLLGNKGDVMGIKFSLEGPSDAGEHDGVKLQSFKMSFDTSGLDAIRAKAIKNVYGGDFKMALAVFDKKAGLAIGQKAVADLSAAIDRSRGKGKGFSASPAFINAAGPRASDSGGFVFMSMSRAIVAGIESTYAALDKPAPKLNLPPSKSGLFIDFSSKPTKLNVNLRMPAEHLQEMGQAIKQLTSLGH